MKEQAAINVVTGIHIILFLSKLVMWIISGSVALISDSLQSSIDILWIIIIKLATRISNKPPDESHQFGYERAQNLAAFFVAVMAWVAWIEIIRYWIEKIITPWKISNPIQTIMAIVCFMFGAMLISYIMTVVWKKHNNAAMMASWKEMIWDVFICLSVIIGVIWSSYFWYLWVDPFVAILIGFLILKIAYGILKDNIDYLMWARADEEQIRIIFEKIFDSFSYIKAIHDIHTQKLGKKIYAILHCEIEDKNYTFKQIHEIEESIANEVMKLDFIHNISIHLDYKNDSKEKRIKRSSVI